MDKNRELFCCQRRLQLNIMDRKAPPPCIRSLYPSLPPLILLCPYANDALSQSEPCVLQCPHRTLDILRPAAQIRGVGAKKACDELPEPQGKGVGGGKDKTTPAPPPAAQLFGPAHEIYTWPSFLTSSPSPHIHPRPSSSIRPHDGGLGGT